MRSSLYIFIVILSASAFTSFSLPHQSSHDVALNCNYEKTIFSSRTYYTCIATNLKVDDESSEISGTFGEHLDENSNSDVEALIVDSQDVKFIPKNLNEIFPNLNRIEVTNTKLEKLSSESFKGLKLEVLKLSKNKIKKIDEKAFEGLKELEILFLDRNEILELSDKTFESLNSLKVLRLENNKIKTFNENLLQNLQELQRISLDDNKIQKLSAETFKNCQNLEEINFSNNKLKFIDSKILENLKSLKKFDFGGNDCTRMTEINESEGKIKFDRIEEIFEEFCGDEDFDPSTSFEIYSHPPSALSELHEELEVEKWEIQAFYSSKIEILEKENEKLKENFEVLEKKLKRFELNPTKEEELKNFEENLKNFEQEKKIFNEEKKIFNEEMKIFNEDQKNLRKAQENFKIEQKNFENDKIILEEDLRVAREFFDAKSKKFEQDLSGCQSTLDCCQKQNEENIKKLQKCEIDLSDAKRNPDADKISKSSLYREQIRINSDLTYRLEECSRKLVFYQQKSRDVEVFSPLPLTSDSPQNLQSNLRRCQESLNDFSNFPLECEFSSADSFYTCTASKIIANHKFMGISATHGNHERSKSNFDVEKLKISNSIFKFLTNEIFDHFVNLQALEIINSKLEELENPKLESTTLIALHVEMNEIREIRKNSFDGVRNLQELFLINDGIEKVESGAFSGLSKLQKLDLKTNKISFLPSGIFNELRSLTHLSVAENEIQSLDGEILRNLENLQVVKFNKNPIKVIGRNLLNYSRALKKFDFIGTCVGDENGTVNEVMWKIENNCREY